MTDVTTMCAIEGCDKSGPLKRGWCGMHYRRWHKYGDPHVNKLPLRVQGTPEERFWPKVDAEGDCWEWLASKTPDGYGRFFGKGVFVYAHRFAWEALVGPIPDGFHIDHLCRNHSCVNPDHLEPVTNAENSRRGVAASVRKMLAARQTHCKHGHEWTPENTYMKPAKDGSFSRVCLICRRVQGRRDDDRRRDEHNARTREYRRRKREAQREA